LDGIQELFGNFGWREAMVLCIVVVTIYFVIMVLRFLQLPRPDLHRLRDYRAPEMRSPPPEFDARPGTALAGIWESPTEPRLDAFLDPLSEFQLATPPVEPLAPPPTPPAEPEGDFSTQLTQKTLEGQVRQLREQLAESRNEIQRMREEMQRLSAAQKVSPLYNEAMALAIRGVDAAGVAGRCGISIAEAELVVALSKRPDAIEEDREERGYGRNA
jgi:hypothetical protein